MLSVIRIIKRLVSSETSLFIMSYIERKMLTLNDLIDITYIPEETDVSLELFVDLLSSFDCSSASSDILLE